MKKIFFTLCVWFLLSAPVFAENTLSNVRFSSLPERDRLVFDLTEIPAYSARLDGSRCILLEFTDVSPQIKAPKLSGNLLKKISFSKRHGRLTVKIFLKDKYDYKIDKLADPPRVFVDILPPEPPKENVDLPFAIDGPADPMGGDKEIVDEPPSKPEVPIGRPGVTPDYTVIDIKPGLTKTIYSRWNEDGPVLAHFVEADPQMYTLTPVLARGRVPNRAPLSAISAASGAAAAINASYFAPNGEILGILKIDGEVCGTTYYKRSAFGIMEDGSLIFGQPTYQGYVTLGDVTLPVSGVDAERGENGLVIYNHWYGSSTGTNEYGEEYVLSHDVVERIERANTPIPKDAVVVSAHGSSKEALLGLQPGDRAEIYQELTEPWNQAKHIVGAGPCLVEDGRIHVTAAEEEFPGDIRYGRAPRSAFGVTREGHYVFAVADGRQTASHGCTLMEWAKLLLEYGCENAINLDGGGSSELILQGKVENSPSDGNERPIGSALVLTQIKQ